MPGAATEIEHRAIQAGEVAPDEGRVAHVGLPAAVEQSDVLL